jgi:hypothetical protein
MTWRVNYINFHEIASNHHLVKEFEYVARLLNSVLLEEKNIIR